MSDNTVDVRPDLEEVVGEVAEEYSQRLREGEKPDIEQYVQRYPEAAEALRQILPALEIMGEVPQSSASAGPTANADGRGMIGEYRIIREVGRGGMGVVYEAEQLSLSRRVALKVLPFAAVLDERQIKRFRNEALAAAQLDHPNIVNVYGVGCERSVHFYAMRFVEGETLAAVIEQLRQAKVDASSERPAHVAEQTEAHVDNSPEQDLTTRPAESEPASRADTSPLAALSTHKTATGREFFRSVARIGCEVAEALDHAHEQGVIHRDIKPGNIIIDPRGKSWITDFGLARIETGGTMTMTGDLVGTLRYMSPEQAMAKRVVVDHRTDIYSLGITLYELLTQQPAFGDEDRHELLRKIAFEEPVSPRKLNRKIPEDLETVVLKAIAKNPNDRYASAQELADDLQRHLHDEPIRARRPGIVQLATKWSRRHSTGVLTTTVVLLLLCVGLVVSNFLIAWEKDEKQRALEHRDKALAEAEASEAKARKVSGLLRSAIASATVKGRDYKVRDLLHDFSRSLEEQQLEGHPEVAAEIHHVLGVAFLNLNEFEEAERHLKESLELRRKTFGVDHLATARADYWYARYLLWSEPYATGESRTSAIERINRVIPVFKRKADLLHLLSAKSLLHTSSCNVNIPSNTEGLFADLKKLADRLGDDRALASALSHHATWLRKHRKAFDEAVTHARQAVELCLDCCGPDDPQLTYHLMVLGNCLHAQGDLKEAESVYRRALGLYSRHHKPGHRDFRHVANRLVGILDQQGKTEEAAKVRQEYAEVFALQPQDE